MLVFHKYQVDSAAAPEGHWGRSRSVARHSPFVQPSSRHRGWDGSSAGENVATGGRDTCEAREWLRRGAMGRREGPASIPCLGERSSHSSGRPPACFGADNVSWIPTLAVLMSSVQLLRDRFSPTPHLRATKVSAKEPRESSPEVSFWRWEERKGRGEGEEGRGEGGREHGEDEVLPQWLGCGFVSDGRCKDREGSRGWEREPQGTKKGSQRVFIVSWSGATTKV